jgi:hypothetical protein
VDLQNHISLCSKAVVIDSQTYVLNQGTFVLESVTLSSVIQFVIEVLVNLARRTVFDKETTEDTHTAHPKDLRRHTGIGSTLSFTVPSVTAGTACLGESTGPAARVHSVGLLDDEPVRNQLANGLACSSRHRQLGLL